MKKLYWKLFTLQDRNKIIFEVPRLINYHGIIIHLSLLSDYCLNLTVEIDGAQIASLADELSGYFAIAKQDDSFNEPAIVFISIRFSDARGEHKSIVPNVPG